VNKLMATLQTRRGLVLAVTVLAAIVNAKCGKPIALGDGGW
jgi:hypothetical protein